MRSGTPMRCVALCLIPLLAACTSTSTVPGGVISSGIVHDHDGDEVRIDPNSEVRFERTDNAWTDWYSAAALLVNDDGVFFEGGEGLRWADVRSAEVKNLSGGKTLVGVVAVSALAVGLVAVAVVARKAPGLPWKVGSTVAQTTAHATLHVVARLPAGGYGSSSGSSGPATSDEPTTTTSYGAYELPARTDARRLFDGTERRRAAIRLGAALDYGAALGRKNEWSASIVPMVRLTDLFEIGGGMRLIREDRVWLARVGLHAELDARRMFALPLSIDLGSSATVAFHSRINFGLRIQVVDGFWLGLHPVNPTYTRLRDPVGVVPHWSFPTTIETSFAF